MKKLLLSFAIFTSLGIAANASAGSAEFFIDKDYDISAREKITAVLVAETTRAYFYADEGWFNLTGNQAETIGKIVALGDEFENVIYPGLTLNYGAEANPGIDNNPKIYVLIHPMKNNFGGYFRSNDGYKKVQISNSNEKEMVYINADYIPKDLAKSLLAHEFTHLITFNQKENKYNITENIWLNELRAEYASTLLHYDDVLEGSNLGKKIKIFSEHPSDALTDWQSSSHDYGSISLFGQYLVDHYGFKILSDSLQSQKTGEESLNYALEKNGFQKKFSGIFIDWTIAVLLNDCKYGKEYCYLNENLKNFHINPQINFLPLNGSSTLTFMDSSKPYAGNWFKIIGGNGGLKYSFRVFNESENKINYITKNKAGIYEVGSLEFMNSQADLNIENFGTDITSLFVIPVFTESDNLFHSFSWSATIEKKQDDLNIINNLLARISELQSQIALLQSQIAAISNSKTNPDSMACNISGSFYFGQKSEGVRCLQEFLKSQGPDIYPEGLITGYFGKMTKSAVIRFQEKYAAEVLTPLGLIAGTGYVGSSTKAKINQLLTI
ncbi:MAG: peptidoglycan-binding protein [bacterium]|nr:peptidoglycan-binding protein [bacterium]